MIAISTAWNYHQDQSPQAMLAQVKEAGLDAVELGYSLPQDYLKALIPQLQQDGIKVSSLHNFCPLPDDGPSPRHASNYYRLSGLDEDERRRAVQWTKNTVAMAVRVGAKAVVIHAGTVELKHDTSAQVLKLCKQGKQDVGEFHRLRDDLLAQRRKERGPFLDSLIKSMKDVLPYAQDKGIVIGLETRYYPTEIPNFDEIGELLDLFYRDGMSYWHDFGHAEVNSRLGISSHPDYFKKYQDRLAGFHIHGVKDLRDHQAPMEGDFDLTRYLPFIKAQHLKVIESHAPATAAQIKQAVELLSS